MSHIKCQLGRIIGVLVLVALPATSAGQEVIYTDSWNDEPDETEELPIYGIGVTEESSGVSPEKVETTLYGDSGEVLDQNESAVGYYYVEAVVGGRLPWSGPEAPQNCAESVHFVFILDYGYDSIGATAAEILPKRYRAVYAKSHFDSMIGKWVYLRESAYCAHKCQGVRYCLTDQYNYIYIPGWKVNVVFAELCLANPPWPRSSITRPACISAGFGSPLVTQDECS
jgi:hypothetical protein